MAPDDSTYRLRLEGRAELLEAARERLRALLPVLRAFRWRERLRRADALVQAVVRTQAEADETVEQVRRRAHAESWPETADVVRCLREVEALRDEATRLVGRRLADGVERPFSEALALLQTRLSTSPRLIFPGQYEQAALELLPISLPELDHAFRFGVTLAATFSRERPELSNLTPKELTRLERAWPAGERALEAVWRRLRTADRAGTLVRHLQRRARHLPSMTPRSGPERLLFAEAWRRHTARRIDEHLALRLNPVQCTRAERFELLRWALRREFDDSVSLEVSPGISAGRAGLFELAFDLSGGRKPSDRAWDLLLERARRADGARDHPDWQRLMQSLAVILAALSSQAQDPTPPRHRSLARSLSVALGPAPHSVPTTLEGRIGEIRRLTERPFAAR